MDVRLLFGLVALAVVIPAAGQNSGGACAAAVESEYVGCMDPNTGQQQTCYGQFPTGGGEEYFVDEPNSCCSGRVILPDYLYTGCNQCCGYASLREDPSVLKAVDSLERHGDAALMANCQGSLLPFPPSSGRAAMDASFEKTLAKMRR